MIWIKGIESRCFCSYEFSLNIKPSKLFLLILTIRLIFDATHHNVLPQKVLTRTSVKLIYILFLFFLVAISAGYHILLYVLFQVGSKMVDIRYFEESYWQRTVILRNAVIVKCVSRTIFFFRTLHILLGCSVTNILISYNQLFASICIWDYNNLYLDTISLRIVV